MARAVSMTKGERIIQNNVSCSDGCIYKYTFDKADENSLRDITMDPEQAFHDIEGNPLKALDSDW